MATYYGGRSECHIRHEVTRVAYIDIRAMYPTVNVLQGLWAWWTAERLEVYDAMEEIRDFLARVGPEDLLQPKTWRHLPHLVLFRPAQDRVPVRAPYVDGGPYQVGFNYLTWLNPLWYTLADAVVSKLHTGRAPDVIQALGFRPVGLNPRLRPVLFRGEVEIDPTREDFIKRLVEERERYRVLAGRARATGSPQDAQHPEAMAAGLKMTANSVAYGTAIEMNRQEKSPQKLSVHGIRSFETNCAAWEKPGRFFHPAVAVMVTGAARLMLTLVELEARKLGADYAMMDTDSLAIAATEQAPNPLAIAETIAKRFTPLNPFNFGGSIVKIEDENFDLVDPDDPLKGVDRSRPEPLYYFGIAAKRYTLLNVTPEGAPQLRRYSEHGLGHLLSPLSKERADGRDFSLSEQEDTVSRTTLAAPGHGRRWIAELWQGILTSILAGRQEVPRFPWSDLPAVGRFTVSHPFIYKLNEGWNTTTQHSGKRVPNPFDRQIKPTNFLLVAYPDSGTLGREVYPTGWCEYEQREHTGCPRPGFPCPFRTGCPLTRPIRPVAPYDLNPENRTRLPWRDLHTGDLVRLTWSKEPSYLATEVRAQTYHDVISRYLTHPEAKAAGGDSSGILEPLHIVATDVRSIGKEANRIDEVQVFGIAPDTYLHYRDNDGQWERTIAILAQIPRRLLIEHSGLKSRQLSAVRNGKAMPHKRAIGRLTMIAEVWERVDGDEQRFHSIVKP